MRTVLPGFRTDGARGTGGERGRGAGVRAGLGRTGAQTRGARLRPAWGRGGAGRWPRQVEDPAADSNFRCWWAETPSGKWTLDPESGVSAFDLGHSELGRGCDLDVSALSPEQGGDSAPDSWATTRGAFVRWATRGRDPTDDAGAVPPSGPSPAVLRVRDSHPGGAPQTLSGDVSAGPGGVAPASPLRRGSWFQGAGRRGRPGAWGSGCPRFGAEGPVGRGNAPRGPVGGADSKPRCRARVIRRGRPLPP